MKEFEYKPENIIHIKNTIAREEEVVVNLMEEWRVIHIFINSNGEYEYNVYELESFDLEDDDLILDGGCYDEIDFYDLKSLL